MAFALLSQPNKQQDSLTDTTKRRMSKSTHPHMLQAPRLSTRGESHRDKVTPFWCIFDQMLGNAYCHQTNPKVRLLLRQGVLRR